MLVLQLKRGPGDKRNNINSFLCLISPHLPQTWHRWSIFYQTLWQKRRLQFCH